MRWLALALVPSAWPWGPRAIQGAALTGHVTDVVLVLHESTDLLCRSRRSSSVGEAVQAPLSSCLSRQADGIGGGPGLLLDTIMPSAGSQHTAVTLWYPGTQPMPWQCHVQAAMRCAGKKRLAARERRPRKLAACTRCRLPPAVAVHPGGQHPPSFSPIVNCRKVKGKGRRVSKTHPQPHPRSPQRWASL